MNLLSAFTDSKRADVSALVNRVHHADCFELMAALPDGSVDMIFCDPPYGHNNNNNGDLIHRWEVALGHTKELQESRPIGNDGQEANEIFRQCLPEFKRLLKPGACCCCCCGGGGPDPQFARWSLWMDEALEYKQMVVWDKGPMGMGWHYRRSYETVLVAQKLGSACKWYDDTNCIENIIRPGMYGISKIIPSKDQHPTQKPVELAEHFIKLHTLPGDLVFDPFSGSGTTAIAARNLGRNFIAGDFTLEYVEMASRRLAAPWTPSLFPEVAAREPQAVTAPLFEEQ